MYFGSLDLCLSWAETETTSIWLRSVVKSAASTSESDLLPQPQVRASFSDWSDRVSTQSLSFGFCSILFIFNTSLNPIHHRKIS